MPVTEFVSVSRSDIHSASHSAARVVLILNTCAGASQVAASSLLRISELAIVFNRPTAAMLLERRLLHIGAVPCDQGQQTKFEIFCRRTNEKATEGFLAN